MGHKRCISSPLTQACKRQRSFCATEDGRLSPHQDGSICHKKHVKFASNVDGSVKTWERYIDVLRIDLDKSNMFYSREEKEEILEECGEAIDNFKQRNLEATSNFEAVSSTVVSHRLMKQAVFQKVIVQGTTENH